MPVVGDLNFLDGETIVSPYNCYFILRYQARLGYQHYKGWTLSITDAHKLLDILEQGRYKSIREIAEVIGKFRQWVYIYMEPLASIEVIDLRGFIYVVISPKTCPKSAEKSRKVYWQG